MNTIDKAEVKNILVVQIGKIGDMMLTIPLFYYLKQACPSARLTILASEKNDEIPKNLSYVDETITYSKNILSSFLLLKSIRKRNYDILIDVNYNFSRTSERILKTIRPKHSFGVNSRKSLYEFDLKKLAESPHLVDIALSAALYLEPNTKPNYYKPLQSQFSQSEPFPEFEGNDKLKVLFNISSGSDTRYWSKENWIGLINNAVKKYGTEKYSYFITGIYANQEDINYVRNHIINSSLTTIKSYSLKGLLQMIPSIDLLISPDTSLIHIASLYNKPVVGLYPNVKWNLEKFKPLSERSEVVISNSHENIFDINEKAVFEKYCLLADQLH